VVIDSTWGTPPNPNIQGATEDAINGVQGWNDGVDTTCTPHAKTGYFLQLVPQTTPANLRDIVIMRNDGITECAGHSSNPTSGSFRNKPDTIFIKSNAANKERWMVTKVIMHELGHALGLDNSKTTTSCGAGDIMGLVTKTADCLVSNVSAYDTGRMRG
jgi:predicted Zn-dependent protease